MSIFSLAANVFYCRNPYAQIATFIMFLVAARKSLCPFVYAEIGNFLAVTFAVVVIEVVYNLPLRHVVELAHAALI